MKLNKFEDVEVRDVTRDNKDIWLVVFYDNQSLEFATEDDACKFQRIWRRGQGRHPITGKPTKKSL